MGPGGNQTEVHLHLGRMQKPPTESHPETLEPTQPLRLTAPFSRCNLMTGDCPHLDQKGAFVLEQQIKEKNSVSFHHSYFFTFQSSV